jgi:VanZ family protein
MPKFEKNTDKLGHMVFHFGITTLWYLYFKYKLVSAKKALIQAFLFSFVYGILIEITQGLFTTTRSADILDVAANTTGALLVVTAILLIEKGKNILVTK